MAVADAFKARYGMTAKEYRSAHGTGPLISALDQKYAKTAYNALEAYRANQRQRAAARRAGLPQPAMPTAASEVPALPSPAGQQEGLLEAGRSALTSVPTPLLYAGAGLIGAGAVAGTIAALAGSRPRKRKSSKSSKRKGGTSSSRRSSAKLGSAKRRNRRGGAVKDKYRGSPVYRTKKGQPYIILQGGPRKGMAKFIRA